MQSILRNKAMTAILATIALAVQPAAVLQSTAYAKTSSEVKAEIAAIQEATQEVEQELSSLEEEYQLTIGKIEEKQAEIASTEAELDESVEAMESHIANTYKMRREMPLGSIIKSIANAESMSEFSKNIITIANVTSHEAQEISDVKEIRDKLSDEKEELSTLQQRQEVTIEDTNNKLRELEEQEEEAKELLKEVEEEERQALIAQMGIGTSASQGQAAAASANTPKEVLDDIIEDGMQFIGTPYVYGGSTPAGFDCSGFVGYILQRHGISPGGRSTTQMIATAKANGTWSTDISTLKRGDPVFPSYGHVAFYYGNGQILHSPRPGTSICIASLYNYAGHISL